MSLEIKASELGKDLANTTEFKEYKRLYLEVYKDEKNKKMIDDFREKAFNFEIKKQKGESTDEDLKNIQNLQNVLSLNPEIAKFLFAENSFSVILQKVFENIEKEIKID